MRVLIAVLAATLALTSASKLGEEELQSLFSTYIAQHGKTYATSEFFSRFNTFKANLEKIREHNADASNSYKLGVNAFTDMTPAEFKSTMLGYNHREQSYLRSQNVANVSELDIEAPAEIDWREKNAVTPVKNQGQCGSCWAFSTTGSVEGFLAISGKGLNSLSEQQLVDCSTKFGNQGCNGGLMDDAFEYIIKNGITTESAYPYTGKDGKCKTEAGEFKITKYADVKSGSESDLLNFAARGPVSVAIEADQLAFQGYKSGIFDSKCGTNLDHGVLVVGYGTESGKDYWIVKNSWGSTWGEKGYIRILRGKNLCGISLSASQPTA